MFINFWYPLARSAELGKSPLRVRALRHDFVLFRDQQGSARCLADICAHRNGSLAGGRVSGDCIECPYHGFQYAGDGRCRRIPTLPAGAEIPERARVDAYPVEERYGLLFAFLGDLPEAERPSILPMPEWGAEGWTTITMEYDWCANYERVVENALDATHAEFAHPSAGLTGQFQRGEQLRIDFIEHDDPWGDAYVIDNPLLELKQGYHGATQAWAHMRFSMGKETGDFRFCAYVTPVDEYRSKRYLLHARNFQLGEKMDEEITKTNWVFEREDRVLLEDMKPVVPPRAVGHDMLLPEEQILARYRRHLREWERRGWRIDSAALARAGEESACVIPSPARRVCKNWVLPTVPRIPESR